MAVAAFRRLSPTTVAFAGAIVAVLLIQEFTAVNVFGLYGELLSAIGLGLTLLALVSFVAFTGWLTEFEGVDARSSRLVQMGNAIRALAVGLALFAVATRWGEFMGLIESWWFLAPIGVGVYVVFVYLNQRTRVASAETAIGRTRRALQRDVMGISNAAVGAILLFVTVALAFISGGLAALSGIGDALAPLAPEIGFGALSLVGLANLGGDFPGADLIPTLEPMQWVLVSIVIFGIALFWSDRQ